MRIIAILILVTMGTGSLDAQPLGFSGMERISDSRFLVVYDKKKSEDGERVAILKVDKKDGYSLKELEIKDWKKKEERPNDLESVCKFPDKEDEFLLVESSYWDGDFGRIFHVRLDKDKLTVKHVYQIPAISPGGKNNAEGDNFEAALCVKNNKKVYVIVGERGGTSRYPNGKLRIGILIPGKNKIDWDTHQKDAIVIKPHNSEEINSALRTITDLHMDEKGVLFVSAATDPGNMGPFTSYVYELGQLQLKKGEIKLLRSGNKNPLAVVDGFKIEALSSCPSFFKDSKLSIGTEDESYPGQWRPLFSGN